MLKKFRINTPPKESLINITDEIKEIVRVSGVYEGVCFVAIPHTTAGLAINSIVDPATALDILGDLRRLIPTRVDFIHTYDTPSDAAGHIKSTLIGTNLSLIIHDGELLLGHSQGVIFCEFDGPRLREINLRIIEDK